MKILHTSDWHLGHVLYGYDRGEEQREMLAQMTDIVRQQRPDAFLLSGDVYHTAQPSAGVQRLFAEALVEMHEACPSMRIIVTAGNHDSGAKHEIYRVPWKALGVEVVGHIDRETPASHIVRVGDSGYVVAVPYCYERTLPEGFFQSLLDTVEQENTAHLPVVLMAHTTVQGCDYKGHDAPSDRTVGGIDALPIDAFGHGYDYLALGHIHHEQWVHGARPHARYCGSPLAVSFDECYEHSVSMVSLEPGGDVGCEQVAIRNPHPLVTLPSAGVVDWEHAKALLADFPADISTYIRLCVEVDDFLPPQAGTEAEELTRGKDCRFCTIRVSRKHNVQRAETGMSVEEFREQKPLDIVRRYAEDRGFAFTPDLEELFDEAERAVQADNAQ